MRYVADVCVYYADNNFDFCDSNVVSCIWRISSVARLSENMISYAAGTFGALSMVIFVLLFSAHALSSCFFASYRAPLSCSFLYDVIT